MNNQVPHHLIEKVLNGTATDVEKKELNKWYRSQSINDVQWPDELESGAEVESRMLKNIHTNMQTTGVVVPIYRKGWFGIAATILIAVTFGAYFFTRPNHATGSQTSLVKTVVAPLKNIENRYLLLPDSSTVLLHPGSNISYAFNEHTREVTLSGEAYFDVKHLAGKPFIIHTGKVKTTVLGTAFNIRAYLHQSVVVSVTRGKVSVINEVRNEVAILLPGNQVEYGSESIKAKVHQVNTQKAIDWVKADVQFNDTPFALLADRLSKRYNVVIKFKNTNLKNCLINGRFDGTESLENLLASITQTIGANYRIENDEVIIDGPGC